MQNTIIVREATEEDFLNIFKFNYQIFTAEIGQYASNESGLRKDKFHHKNKYFIALDDLKIVGLLAVHCKSPYSAQEKFVEFDKMIPEGRNIAEIRLFSVDKAYRGSSLSWRLLSEMIKYLLTKDIDYIVISAIDNQVKLYKKLGFSIFGQSVQIKKAVFYPMYAKFDDVLHNKFIKKIQKDRQMKNQDTIKNRLYFDPSLACLHPKVGDIDVMSLAPHRSDTYTEIMKNIDRLLLKMLGNENFSSILLAGNGTLANEIMVANLMLSSKSPAVLINGEFGQRLYAQCLKYNPHAVAIDFGFANNIDVATLELKLKNIDALFFVALETSAGIMNPVKQICKVCETLDIKMGIDAISAMGSQKIDFSSKNISFVTASSGKNLLSIPGIAIIFMRKTLQASTNNTLPTSIDMGYLLNSKNTQGLVKNTLSYFLIQALHISLNELIYTVGVDKQYQKYRAFRQMITVAMDRINISILENCNTTNILSFYCPATEIWDRILKVLKEENIAVYHEATYLKRNHIFQIAYMGFCKKEDIERMLDAFSKATKIK